MKKAEVQMVLHRQAGSHNTLIAISCGVNFNKYLSLSPSFTEERISILTFMAGRTNNTRNEVAC